jgi:hypothetical protein
MRRINWKKFIVIPFLLSIMTLLLPLGAAPVKAATDGSFRVAVPNSGNLVQGCLYAADVYINTGSNTSNSADIIINYDPSKIEIVDSVTDTSGVQIKPGTAYEAYFGNVVDTTAGKIRLTGGSFVGGLSGEAIFATIQFRGKTGATQGAFTIGFTGSGGNNTYDSNIAIAQNSQDALGSVSNASVNFAQGSCIADSIPPVILFVNPSSPADIVSGSEAIKVNIRDSLSGVNKSTVQIIINGIPFTADSPETTVTGSPDNYLFTIRKIDAVYSKGPSSILVRAKDFNGNSKQSYITFNLPQAAIVPTEAPIPSVPPTPTPVGYIPDTGSPTIEFISPVSHQTISNDDEITIKVSDQDKGVNITSLQLFVNEKKYTSIDENLDVTGTPASYTIKVRDKFNFPKTTPSFLTVFIADVEGNVAAGNLSFNIPDVLKEEDGGTIVRPTPPVKQSSDFFDLEKFIQNIGKLGVAALLLSTPLLWRALATLLGLLSNRLLLAFIKALFIGKDRKYGYVIHEGTKEKIDLVHIEVLDPASGTVVQRGITNFSGRYFIHLPAGMYHMMFYKPGFKAKVVEYAMDAHGAVEKVMKLEPSLPAKRFRLFTSNKVTLLAYCSLLLSTLNILFVRSILSVTILVVSAVIAAVITELSRLRNTVPSKV